MRTGTERINLMAEVAIMSIPKKPRTKSSPKRAPAKAPEMTPERARLVEELVERLRREERERLGPNSTFEER